MNKKDSERIQRAVEVAKKAHEGQFRKTGEPYIVHPLAVKKILEEWGMDEDTIIAGIVHDTVEDTNLTLDDIRKEFGESVAFLVDGVTKLSTARNGMRDIDTYLPETKDNFLRLMIALGDDIRVLIIKLADRLHNLRTLSALPPDKQRKIAKETLEVFAPLADRLNMGLLRVEMSDLAFKYVDPKRYAYLKDLIEKRKSTDSFNVALIGAWGAGKTSITDTLISEFETENTYFCRYGAFSGLTKWNISSIL